MSKKMIVYVSVVAVFLSLSGGGVYAQSSKGKVFCNSQNKVVLYGQNICADSDFNEREMAGWFAGVERLHELLPQSSEDQKTAPEVCEHLRRIQNLYSRDAETHILKVTTRLDDISKSNDALKKYIDLYNPYIQNSESAAYIAINRAFLDESNKVANALINYFPEVERGYILRVRDVTLKAKYMTYFYDSALDACPDYAAKNHYYKMTYYNGPDANYDPAKDPSWKNVPWAKKQTPLQ